MVTKEAKGIEEPEPYGVTWMLDRISDIMARRMAEISPNNVESSMSFQLFASITLDSAIELYKNVCDIKNPEVRALAKGNMDKHIISEFTNRKHEVLDNPGQAPHCV